MNLADKAFSEWYTLAGATGAILAGGAALTGNQEVLLLGSGLLLLGIGEFVNHPYQEIVRFDDYNRPIDKLSGRPRRNIALGLALGGIGIFAIVAAIFRLAFT